MVYSTYIVMFNVIITLPFICYFHVQFVPKWNGKVQFVSKNYDIEQKQHAQFGKNGKKICAFCIKIEMKTKSQPMKNVFYYTFKVYL